MIHISPIMKKIMLCAMVGSFVMPCKSSGMDFNNKHTIQLFGSFVAGAAMCYCLQFLRYKSNEVKNVITESPKNKRPAKTSNGKFNSLLEQINVHPDKPQNLFVGYYLGDLATLQAGESANLSMKEMDVKKQRIIFDYTHKSFIVDSGYKDDINTVDLKCLNADEKNINYVLYFNSLNYGRAEYFRRVIDFNPTSNTVKVLKSFYTGTFKDTYLSLRIAQNNRVVTI